jgi:hypothetical protein
MRKSLLLVVALSGLYWPVASARANQELTTRKGNSISIIYYRMGDQVSHITIGYRPVGTFEWRSLLDADVQPRFMPIPATFDLRDWDVRCKPTGCNMRVSGHLIDRKAARSFGAESIKQLDATTHTIEFWAGRGDSSPNTVVTITEQ